MVNNIEELLEDYSIFFRSGKFDLGQLKKDFSTSEYYSWADNQRYYDLYEILDSGPAEGQPPIKIQSFDQFLTEYLANARFLFRDRLLKQMRTINSDVRQNAILYSLLADLQNYVNILAKTEEECKSIMKEVIDSRNFILSLYSEQLGFSTKELPHEKRESLSSYFRGIKRIQFHLQKREVALLFLLLRESHLMAFPISDTDLAKFLDNNIQYYSTTECKYLDIQNSKTEISKIRDEGYEERKENLIKKLKDTIIVRKKG